MVVDPITQAEFERNLTWKRSWPACIITFIAIIEVLLAVVILGTEVLSILVDFWHSNVFGGIWGSIILLINWILIFVTVCCTTTVRASTCSFVWNWITLVALATLIAFDILFIIKPETCLLTPSCSTRSALTSSNEIIQKLPNFENYTIYDSKKFLFEVQVGCAGLAFILTIIYIVIFIVCRVRFRKHFTGVSPVLVNPPQRGLRIAQAPQIPYAPY